MTCSAQVLIVPAHGVDEGEDAVMTCEYEKSLTTDDLESVEWSHKDNGSPGTQLFFHFAGDKNGNPFNDWTDRGVTGTFLPRSHTVRLPTVMQSDSKEYVCTYRLHNGSPNEASSTLYINGLLLLI